MTTRLQLIPLQDFPLVEPGDKLDQLLLESLQANELGLEDGDLLVLAQKIVSKAEGRYVRLAEVEPGPEAIALAEATDKDPRQVELILRESREVLRSRPGVIIVEHQLGYVHANAGIDKSNIPRVDSDPSVLLLPKDSDRSAEALRLALAAAFGAEIAVIINDSAGRAWRNGTVGMAIGSAGMEPLSNQIGDPDLFGRELEVTEVAVADELAAAASLVMGQADEGCPVVLVRGARWQPAQTGSRALLRERELDMFR
ncbi:MAG: coenzyme F420-0:L-glutamate ligase [Gammaproteobacteria bacterium]|nr:coenzyme F420-0:L-glutamate ligase [Gammaproteobacteria bacterium]